MNKIVKIITLNLDDDTKNDIKRVIDQLEKHNYALTTNGKIPRLLSKYIPPFYKENDIVMFTRYRKHPKSIIIIDPKYNIERKTMYCFRIRLR